MWTSFPVAVSSAVGSWALLRLGRRMPSAAREPWARTNHAGRTVTLLEGPSWVGGALAGVGIALMAGRRRTGSAASTGSRPQGSPAATALVALAAGALGALDDLAGGAADKGLKGHLGALARGQVTTGAVKVVGLGACGLLGAAVSDTARDRTDRSPGPQAAPARVLGALVGGAVVAGAANAVNLFDLRPGRALKVTLAAGLPLAGTPAAAAAVGASLGVLPDDLRATSMLGDTGANAAGALLGLALVERTGLAGRAAALTGLAALTLASERVSFTRVIERNRVLRRLDEWGREAR
ncbi:hypothetical protein GCM10009740_08950 [Terrabacter terrae]|uniref:Glycosyl transferase family 4 n=1 Tax=Terrabacter terrae TaxID=318434 RepID=A0ABN2TV88_9MICO